MPGLICRRCGKFMHRDETDGVSWRCSWAACPDGQANLKRRGLGGYLDQRLKDLNAEIEGSSISLDVKVAKIAMVVELNEIAKLIWEKPSVI